MKLGARWSLPAASHGMPTPPRPLLWEFNIICTAHCWHAGVSVSPGSAVTFSISGGCPGSVVAPGPSPGCSALIPSRVLPSQEHFLASRSPGPVLPHAAPLAPPHSCPELYVVPSLMSWLESEVSKYKLLSTGWINTKVLQHSTGNCVRCPGIKRGGKEYEKESIQTRN